MRTPIQSYRHIGIREVPRGAALVLAGALEAHGAACTQLGWGRVVYGQGVEGEAIRVTIPEDRALMAVVRWDAPSEGGRRVELEPDDLEIEQVRPAAAGRSNGGRAKAAALLERIEAMAAVRAHQERRKSPTPEDKAEVERWRRMGAPLVISV